MSNLKVAGAVLLCGLWLGGCATNAFVKKKVAEVYSHEVTTEKQVAQHDTHLGTLDKTTQEALARADAAGKLAQGKFVYSMVLSDDATKFPVDGSKLSDEAKARLTEFAAKLKTDNRNVFVEIQGYTDDRGSPEFNLRLGAERAEAVRRFLNSQGVALSRMSTISYGVDNPVASNKTREGRAQNRRVVLIVLS